MANTARWFSHSVNHRVSTRAKKDASQPICIKRGKRQEENNNKKEEKDEKTIGNEEGNRTPRKNYKHTTVSHPLQFLFACYDRGAPFCF